MRYAVYFTPPPGAPLAVLGAAFLGRDPFSGAEVAPAPVPGLSPARVAEITADPRRYGFHATLKAPFALADGSSEADLEAALAALAETLPALDVPLRVGRLGGFVALVPDGPADGLRALCDGVVDGLDRFRRPAGAAELARRRRVGLSAAEEANLLVRGYPYLGESFRFHMTLSCRLAGEELDLVEAAARDQFGRVLAHPVPIDTLGLFVEPEPGAPFHVLGTAPLAAAHG